MFCSPLSHIWNLTDKSHTFFQKIIYFAYRNLEPSAPPPRAPRWSLTRTVLGCRGFPVGARSSFPTAFGSVLAENAAQMGTEKDKYSWKLSVFFSVCFSRCVMLKTVNGAHSMWYIRLLARMAGAARGEKSLSVFASSDSGTFL